MACAIGVIQPSTSLAETLSFADLLTAKAGCLLDYPVFRWMLDLMCWVVLRWWLGKIDPPRRVEGYCGRVRCCSDALCAACECPHVATGSCSCESPEAVILDVLTLWRLQGQFSCRIASKHDLAGMRLSGGIYRGSICLDDGTDSRRTGINRASEPTH